MSKRRGDPMTKDDFNQRNDDDDEDDDELKEGFVKASEQVLAHRRIIKAKRPIHTATPSTKVETKENEETTTTTVSKPSETNPFASVNLVASTAPAPAPAPAPTTEKDEITMKPEESEKAEKTAATTSPNDKKSETEKATSLGSFATTPSAAKKARTNEDNDDKKDAKNETTTTSTSKPFVFGAATGFRGFATAASNGSTGFGSGGGGFASFAAGSGTSTAFSSGFGSFGSQNKDSQQLAFVSTTTATISSSLSKDETSNSAEAAPPSFESKTTTTTAAASQQPVAQLPVNYELKSGEEDETVILELRCKTYRRGPSNNTSSASDLDILKNANTVGKNPSVPHSESLLTTTTASKTSDDSNQDDNANVEQSQDKNTESKTLNGSSTTMEWHEVGIGPLKILRHNQKPTNHRMVQRRESTPGGSATIVILNARLREFVVSSPSEKHVQIVVVMQDPHPVTTYLFKCKLAADAMSLKSCLENIQKQLEGQQQELQQGKSVDDSHSSQQDDTEKNPKEKHEISTEEKTSLEKTE